MRVALATGARWPQGIEDDRPLAGALGARGHRADFVVWSDSGSGWKGFDAVVVRSCWDSHRRPRAFRAWLERLARQGPAVFNPPALCAWSHDKARYLSDLAVRGVPVVPTLPLRRGSPGRLAELRERLGSAELVVKPSVGAWGHGCWRASGAAAEEEEARLARQLARRDLLVQPFLPEVLDEGEWSVVALDGKVSHALLKRAPPRDFRTHHERGGTVEARPPDGELAAAARRVLAAVEGEPLYARVDLVRSAGALLLLELELVEPELYFRCRPASAELLVRGLERRVAA